MDFIKLLRSLTAALGRKQTPLPFQLRITHINRNLIRNPTSQMSEMLSDIPERQHRREEHRPASSLTHAGQ